MIFSKKNAASRLKHQLILQQRQTTPDTIGGYTSTWEDVATLWAEIMPISGSESLAMGQITAKQRYRIRIRYRSTVTPSMQLFDAANSRIFSIQSVINRDERKQLLEIIADHLQPQH